MFKLTCVAFSSLLSLPFISISRLWSGFKFVKLQSFSLVAALRNSKDFRFQNEYN